MAERLVPEAGYKFPVIYVHVTSSQPNTPPNKGETINSAMQERIQYRKATGYKLSASIVLTISYGT